MLQHHATIGTGTQETETRGEKRHRLHGCHSTGLLLAPGSTALSQCEHQFTTWLQSAGLVRMPVQPELQVLQSEPSPFLITRACCELCDLSSPQSLLESAI